MPNPSLRRSSRPADALRRPPGSPATASLVRQLPHLRRQRRPPRGPRQPATSAQEPDPTNLGDPLAITAGKLLFGFRGAINGTGNADDFHPMRAR